VSVPTLGIATFLLIWHYVVSCRLSVCLTTLGRSNSPSHVFARLLENLESSTPLLISKCKLQKVTQGTLGEGVLVSAKLYSNSVTGP
jgi:hypothetical protein